MAEQLQCYSCGTIFTRGWGIIYCPSCYNSVSIGPVDPEEFARHREWKASQYRAELDARTRNSLRAIIEGHFRFRKELRGGQEAQTREQLRLRFRWIDAWGAWFDESEKAVHTLTGIEIRDKQDEALVNEAARDIENDLEIINKLGMRMLDLAKAKVAP